MPHEPLPVDDFMDQQGVIESGGGEHEQGGIVEEKLNFCFSVLLVRVGPETGTRMGISARKANSDSARAAGQASSTSWRSTFSVLESSTFSSSCG